MLKKIKNSVSILIIFQCLILAGFAQEGKRNNVSSVVRNKYSPNLYVEKLNFRVTLVDLPGAKVPESNWQTSYEIYFVSEENFDNMIPKIGRREPVLQDFSEKILLAGGDFKKNSLQGISQRIVEKNAVVFATKIPKNSKTEFAKIITFFTVKIYDAKLKETIYRTGLFVLPPFVSNGSEKNPIRNLFLNFFVTDSGILYTSNLERSKTNTDWQR